MPNIRARRIALCTMFLIPGLGLASWVTRTPAIRDELAASTAEMGFVLFGLSAGSMLGILASGPLVTRTGARPIMALGQTSLVAGIPLIGLGAAVSSSLLVASGLFFFGLGMGGSEIAMNVEGADVETVTARPFLPSLHGFFSLGTVIGASAGIAFTAWDFSVIWHLLIVGTIALLAFVLSIRHLPAATGRSRTEPDAAGRRSRAKPRVWKDPGLIPIGVIILAMALAEGTANDWLPLVMVDGHGLDESLGSAVFAVFAAAMTAGRLFGGRFVFRYGRSRVLAASAISAAIGLAVVSLVDHQATVGIAVVFWGLGASLGFPVALSAAGDAPENSAARVAFVATMGYIAFLVGPPALGLLGEAITLRGALLAPMALVLVAALLTPATREQAQTKSAATTP